MLQTIGRLLVIGLIMVLVGCNLRLYTPSPQHDEFARVARTLDDYAVQLDAGVAHEMQQLFPEGYYFSHVWYGLARADLAAQGVQVERNVDEALEAYRALDSTAGRQPFSATLDPPYGIFYLGWRTYLLGRILSAQTVPDGELLGQFERDSAEIALAIQNSPHPFLPSYPNQIWPVDTLPAVAALKLHTHLIDNRYDGLIDDWLPATSAYRDPATGLLPHRLDGVTGAIVEGARATSQTLIVRFMAEIDPVLAQSDYVLLREQFLVRYMGLPGVREYPHGVDKGGDVDSGPLVMGVSLSATAALLGTARALGDAELGRHLWQSAELIAIPLPTPNGRRYLAAQPFAIANVFAAWSAATPLAPIDAVDATTAHGWRLPIHLVSGVLVGVMGLGVARSKPAPIRHQAQSLNEPQTCANRSAFDERVRQVGDEAQQEGDDKPDQYTPRQ